MMTILQRPLILPRLCLLILSSAVGCATPSPATARRPAVFYPPLPNPPRIQYLASFSSAKDIAKPRSSLAEFLAGKDPEAVEGVKKPYGVASHSGKIYAVDVQGGGYAVFDLVNQDFRFVQGSGPGRMQKPTTITIDSNGDKYIADIGVKQVLVFDAEDEFVRAYGAADQFKPGGLTVTNDRLYVSDLKTHDIQVLDKQSGRLLFKFASAGAKDGELHYPTNMVIGSDGYLYVTDTMNFRVQKFTLDGQFVHSFGSMGTSGGQFARPKGVAVDRESRLYVVDAAFENVQIFDRNGRLLLFFGAPGGDPEAINLPTTVAIDYDSVPLFQKYADPRFTLEYVILVASQFGASKIGVFGFGRMAGADYSADSEAEVRN